MFYNLVIIHRHDSTGTRRRRRINLFPDRTTGYSKGCGFVIYRRQEDAQNLMTNSGGEMALPVSAIISWAAMDANHSAGSQFQAV